MLKGLVCLLILSTTLGTYFDQVLDPYIPECFDHQLVLQQDVESNEEELFSLLIVSPAVSNINEDYGEVLMGFLQFESVHEEEPIDFSLNY